MMSSQSASFMFLKLTSLRIPALLSKMWTVPNAFTAVSMMRSPNSTES